MKTTFINSSVAEYTDSEFSWLQSDVMESGYFALQDGTKTFQITQKTVPSLGIDISAGKILLPYAKSGISWKLIVESNATQSFTITPNISGANRIDAVIVKLDIVNEPNALKTNIATVQVIQGTGATALTDGAIQTIIGSDYVFTRLGDITVPTGATTILDSNIVNLLEKVKISKAVSVDSDSIIYSEGNASGNYISEVSGANIPAMQPVSVNRVLNYKTDETISGNSLGERIVQLSGGNVLPSDRPNTRGGIYTLYGYDWNFFLVNGVINYARKVIGNTGTWSAPVSTGIAVMDGNNRNWTMGCDESTGRFVFAYVKNMGVTDGKMYHRMGQADASGITLTSEIVAWTDSTWKVKTNQNSYDQSMDSEVINGKYYVVFQNTNGTNYKCTVIGSTTLDGTWTSAPSTPHDMDSDFASGLHGIGGAIGGIGGGKAGIMCSRRTTGSPYPINYLIYKQLDTITGSFGSVEVVFNGGQNNPSYDWDMTRFSSVSFLDKTPFIMTNKSTSGSYSEDSMKSFKKQANGVWLPLAEKIMKNVFPNGLSFARTGVICTDGKKLYASSQDSDGGGSQLFNCPLMSFGSNGIDVSYNTRPSPSASYFFYNMFPGRSPASNAFGVVSWLRAVQNGKGCQNAFGFISNMGGTTTLRTNYWKTYAITPSLTTSDFTTKENRLKFAGFNKNALVNGLQGTIQVTGLMDGFSNLVPNQKYWISSGGLIPYEITESVYIGIAKSKTAIELDIKNIETLEQTPDMGGAIPGYSALVPHATVQFDYDGELKTPTLFKTVVVGEIADTSGGNVYYRRLQK